MKYQLPDGNIIVADQAFINSWYPDATLLPEPPQPVAVKVWSAFEFYRILTAQERIAIRTLAKTDPVAEDFMHTLDAALSSGTNVRADDPDLQAGMAYLASKSIFTSERVTEILS